MAITSPPKVRLELDASGRGKAFINDFELPFVTRIKLEVSGQHMTRVSFDICAEVEATLDGAEIEINALNLAASHPPAE